MKIGRRCKISAQYLQLSKKDTETWVVNTTMGENDVNCIPQSFDNKKVIILPPLSSQKENFLSSFFWRT